MSGGQMMLVIGAFMLFGMIRLNFQNSKLESELYLETNTSIQQSSIIARAMMDDILTYKFDAALNWKRIIYPSDLTACGPGGGEVYPTFNDMDDFHGQVFRSPILGTTPSSIPPVLWGTEGFTVRTLVEYVDPDNPNNKSWTRTFAKRVNVVVENEFTGQEFSIQNVECYY